jgi:flagellar biosynthesis GTPase FlhF
VATILLLVENGAKLQARDKYGQTPLHYAVKPRRWYPKRSENVEATALLLEKDVVFTIRDRGGRTPEDLSNRAIGLVRNTLYTAEVENHDYDTGFRNLVPPTIRCSKEFEEIADVAEWRIKRLLEAKRVASVVERLDKDLALRMEKFKIVQKVQKYQTTKNREQRARKRKDAAVREATRKAAERKLAESTLRASRELEERRKEEESIRLAEQRRTERRTAAAIKWSHLRQEAEMKKLALAETIRSRCFHSSTGRLKSKGGTQCEECKEMCRQQAYKCPDCASVVCVQCHRRSRLSPGSL